jgi:hypothetical protein
MRGLLLVGVVTVGLGALAGGEDPQRQLPSVSTSNASGQTFKLASGGNLCLIHRGRIDEAGGSRISLDPDCGSALPLLATAERWRTNTDGSISLIGADGRSLIEFAAADGEGYESFGKGAPMASLYQAD